MTKTGKGAAHHNIYSLRQGNTKKVQRTVIFFIMANTYTQCYFQLVFSVKNRDALIKKSGKNEIEFRDEYVFEFFDDVGWE